MKYTIKTCDDFNKKWKHHLEDRHYGMAICDEDIIQYMDKEFEAEESHNPNFTFSQIKLKFGMARVYVENTQNEKQGFIWEDGINKTLKKEDKS